MSIHSRLIHTVAALGFVMSGPAQALSLVPYEAQALANAQAADLPVALHFHAAWCPTCRAQTKSLEAMKSEPDLNITVFVVDYDKETELKKLHKVRTQSTLIVFRGKTEKARQIGSAAPDDLRTSLRSAL